MYYSKQVIYDLETKRPVQLGSCWDFESYPRRHTHFIEATGDLGKYEIALPKTVEEAQVLLDRNLITPAPIAVTHCWNCQHWKMNCKCELSLIA